MTKNFLGFSTYLVLCIWFQSMQWIDQTPLNLGAEKTKYKENFMSLAGNNTIGSTITLVEQGISESQNKAPAVKGAYGR